INVNIVPQQIEKFLGLADDAGGFVEWNAQATPAQFDSDSQASHSNSPLSSICPETRNAGQMLDVVCAQTIRQQVGAVVTGGQLVLVGLRHELREVTSGFLVITALESRQSKSLQADLGIGANFEQARRISMNPREVEKFNAQRDQVRESFFQSRIEVQNVLIE